MNELIDKLTKEAAALQSQMAAAVLASEADGVTEDDKKKHVAEFHTAEAKLKDVDQRRARAVATRDAEAAAAAFQQREREPATAPIVARPVATPGAGRPVAIPARQARTSVLHAFRGPDAEARAYQAGLFAAATVFGHAPSQQAYQDNFGDIRATLSTTNNGGAAYFVPEVMENSIIELVEQFGVARRYCDLVPMGSAVVHEPRWTGGLTAYFVAEGSAPTQSDPTWDSVSLSAKDLAAYGKITRQLNEDAIINLGDKWAMAGAIAFAEKEDDCLFNGTGTSTYGGITGVLTKLTDSANAASLYTATGHTTLSALTIDDLETVMGMLPEHPGIRPAWFMHKTVYHAGISPLKNAAGGTTPADLANGGQPTYGGYPVVFVQKMPRSSSVTSGVTGIAFGDLRLAAKFGSRRGQTFERGLDGNDFSKQLMSMLFTERFDINVHTVVDPRNSSLPGPVIGLKLG